MDFPIPWLPSSIFKTSKDRSSPHRITLTLSLFLPPASTYKDPGDYIGPKLIQENLPILNSAD